MLQDTNFILYLSFLSDLEKLKEGIADKLGIYIFNASMFVVCMILAFCYGWKLTLVIMTGAPLIIFSTIFMVKVEIGHILILLLE